MSYVQSRPTSPRGSRAPATVPVTAETGPRRPRRGGVTLRAGLITALVVVAWVCSVRPALCQPAPTFPDVDLSKLDDAARATFLQIVEEQFCPCGKPQSFRATLQAPDGCPVATALGQQLAADLGGGMARRDAIRSLLKRIANINARFAFATAKSPRLGPTDPKVEVVIFSDFECPFCREISGPVQKLVKDNRDVSVVYKFYPISFHEHAEPAARAAWAALQQGKFWEMHDQIFAHQKELTADLLTTLAKDAGLNLDRFRKDMASPAAKGQIDSDKAEGDKAGVEGTPTVFVNGLFLDDPTELKQAIDAARKM